MRCGLRLRHVTVLLITIGFGIIALIVLLLGGFAGGSRVPIVVSAPVIGGELPAVKFALLLKSQLFSGSIRFRRDGITRGACSLPSWGT